METPLPTPLRCLACLPGTKHQGIDSQLWDWPRIKPRQEQVFICRLIQPTYGCLQLVGRVTDIYLLSSGQELGNLATDIMAHLQDLFPAPALSRHTHISSAWVCHRNGGVTQTSRGPWVPVCRKCSIITILRRFPLAMITYSNLASLTALQIL